MTLTAAAAVDTYYRLVDQDRAEQRALASYLADARKADPALTDRVAARRAARNADRKF